MGASTLCRWLLTATLVASVGCAPAATSAGDVARDVLRDGTATAASAKECTGPRAHAKLDALRLRGDRRLEAAAGAVLVRETHRADTAVVRLRYRYGFGQEHLLLRVERQGGTWCVVDFWT